MAKDTCRKPNSSKKSKKALGVPMCPPVVPELTPPENSLTRDRFIEILKMGKRHKNPEITFWIDNDICLELEDAGEFAIAPEINLSFKVVGRCASTDSPEDVKRDLLGKYNFCKNCNKILPKMPDGYKGRSPKCPHCGFQDMRK